MPEKNKKKISKKFTAEVIKDSIVKEIVSLNHGRAGDAQVRPNMAIVMIGEDKKSTKFLDNLDKASKKVGIDTHVYKCPSNSDEDEIKAMIECLNKDDLIDGIYLQLPLPDNFNIEETIALIRSDKELNYTLEGKIETNNLREAKLFKGALDNFKNKQIEEL